MEPARAQLLELYPQRDATENHTQEYDLIQAEPSTGVYRRGCNFHFTARFDKNWDAQNDVIRVHFGCGPKPNVVQGTKISLCLHPKNKSLDKDPLKWSIVLVTHEGKDVQIKAHIPPSVPVGIWHITIETNVKGDRQNKHVFKHPDDVYIVFNPWCPQDSVYMKDEAERTEYILNESGKIWCGTFKNPTGKPWIFGQFDDICLPASVFLLEKSGLAHADRASPVAVTRAISAIINSVDDGGLLEESWDGEYEDGTSPHAWTGSANILSEYLMSGGEPVKYGQCWVFSAAVVTVCRTLGIPCRSVTNYVSAHDTNCSLTVDKYFDKDGNKIENGPEGDCKDSCWNFHVWNDVWMTRPDLPPGYGGWQIIDATPQELSDNQFKCGPASVEAVRKGEVGYLYDTPFVFSEVNADVIHFREDADSDWGFTRASINSYHVGKKIITKKVGLTDPDGITDLEDVTKTYKNREGTESERLAMYNAVRGVPRAQSIYELPNKEQEDVNFDLVDIDTIPFGDSFEVVVNIENNSTATRSISAVLSASSIYYTGVGAKAIKKSQGTLTVKPGHKEVLKIAVTAQDYLDKLVDHSLIKIYAIANVHETKQVWSEEDDFTLIKPAMTINCPEMSKVGQQCAVDFAFKNPLNQMLTKCVYRVEGPGLAKPKTTTYRDVLPNELVTIREVFEAKKTGERAVIANFTSKEIQGITGSRKILIQE